MHLISLNKGFITKIISIFFIISLLFITFYQTNDPIIRKSFTIPSFEEETKSIDSDKDILKNSPQLFVQPFQKPNILFYIGNDTGVPDINLDEPFYDFLTIIMNYSVTYRDDKDATSSLDEFDLILISASASESGSYLEPLKTIPIPILTMQAGTYDEFHFGDQGYGLKQSNSIYIVNDNHYITTKLRNQTYFDIYEGTLPYGPITYIKGYNFIPEGTEINVLAKRNDQLIGDVTWLILDKGKKDWEQTPSPERRAFFGPMIQIPSTFNENTWFRWNRTLSWLLYDDVPGNATVSVNVLDLDDERVPNARVNLTNINNDSISLSQNTTEFGETIFINISFGIYNISVEFEDSINDSLSNIEIAGIRTYNINPIKLYLVYIPEFVDNLPPIIQNVNFEKTNKTFSANLYDSSNIQSVNLSITVRNVTTGQSLRDAIFNMVTVDKIKYFNNTALEGLPDSGINISYNISAIDVPGNLKRTPNYWFTLGDDIAPNIEFYNVTDFGNGSLTFYASVIDEQSLVQEVILDINEHQYNMIQNASGLWIYHALEYYGVELNYTILSAIDQVGNENNTPNPRFGLVTPNDTHAPLVYGVTDTFASHSNGDVDFEASINDWNNFQSGINISNVIIFLSIYNGSWGNISRQMIKRPGGTDKFDYNYTFQYNDTVYYWISASDLAGNLQGGFEHGPFVINDNSIPQVTYGAVQFGNGSVEFNSTVYDWPNNDTIVVLFYTQNYFDIWYNTTMNTDDSFLFFHKAFGFDFAQQYVWYYVIATDSGNNSYIPTPDQFLRVELTDYVSPQVIFSIQNSTTNDCEITITAWALDYYGNSLYTNNTFYANISVQEVFYQLQLNYSSFYFYTLTISLKYQDNVTFILWTHDDSGNLGVTNRSFIIEDFSPPKILDFGAINHQNGSCSIWAKVEENPNGSGMSFDNSSVVLIYTYKQEYVVTMKWNGSGNFYEYTITPPFPGLEPEDAVFYRINVMDNAGNINSVFSLPPFTILDETPPIILNWNYSQIYLSSSSLQLNFWVEAYDPFGTINTVEISIFNYNTSEWMSSSQYMEFIGSNKYQYVTSTTCSHILNVTILVKDGKNVIKVQEIELNTLDFCPPEIVDFGYTFCDDSLTIGQYQFYFEIDQVVKSEWINISLSIFDDTNLSWIIQNKSVDNFYSRNSNIIYCLNISMIYDHNFSYYCKIEDNGSNQGFYIINNLNGTGIAEDNWGPNIIDSDLNDYRNGTLMFWATIVDWGSGIEDVSLYYFQEDNSGGQGSELSLDYTRLEMVNNGSHFIAKLNLKSSGAIYWNIKAIDASNNSNLEPFNDKTYLFTYSEKSIDLSELFPLIIIAGVIPTVIVFSVLAIRNYHRRRADNIKNRERKIAQRFSDIMNVRAIICRNTHGLPFYTEEFSGQIGDLDLTAGLTSAVSNLVSEVSRRPFKKGEFDLLEREGFGILSHHNKYSTITVVSEGKLSEIMKKMIIELHDVLESHFTQVELEDTFLESNPEKIRELVYKHLLIGLLRPLTFNFELLKNLKKQFSKSELNALRNVNQVPSLIDGQLTFYVMTFTSTLTFNGVPLTKAYTLLEKCYNLEIIKVIPFSQMQFINLLDSEE